MLLPIAHGLPSPPGVPVPGYLFAWSAAGVLLLSFVALGAMWREPRLEDSRARRLFAIPRAVEIGCGAIGVALFALLVYCGLAGTQIGTRNLTPTAIYVVVWVGLVPVSAALGDVFSLFNPWRAIGRAAGALAGRRVGQPLPYPERLGRWPAALGILAFAWLELVYTQRSDPPTLALLMLVYATIQLLGMAFYGVERWTDRADAFGVYFGLFARLSPLELRGREIWRRRFLSGVPALVVLPGTTALLFVMLGSTSFDGLSSTVTWRDLVSNPPSELAGTLGLATMIGVVAAVYSVGIRGMHEARGVKLSIPELRARFIHTLVPIAFAYVLAHYCTFLLYQGQAIGFLVSDPLGHGSDLFGTAHATIDYHLLSKAAVWYLQVGALVCGHVAAIALAHDRALALFPDRRLATRTQQWMLTAMVGFTSLGLWLLASIKG